MAAEGKDCWTFDTAWTANGFPGLHVYVVAVQGSPEKGILGVSFGIDYNPALIGGPGNFLTFTSCTDGTVLPHSGPNGDFPEPESGICVSWSTCQNTLSPSGNGGVHTSIGAFYMYVYSAGSFSITPAKNPTDEISVTDCTYNTINLLDYYDPALWPHLSGRVDFGGGSGYTPCGHHPHLKGEESAVSPRSSSGFCGLTPTVKTTWGVIKDLYRNNHDD